MGKNDMAITALAKTTTTINNKQVSPPTAALMGPHQRVRAIATDATGEDARRLRVSQIEKTNPSNRDCDYD